MRFRTSVPCFAQVKYITVGGLPVATRIVGGIHAGIYYLHADHLGSLQALTNASGQGIQRLTYKPYGETFSNTGSVDFEQHRFTGQELDSETGLYFYHARYYNPTLGRFLSPDPVVPGASNPQSLNRYSYVGNNPVNLIDPSGHFSLGSLFSSLLPMAAGVGVGLLAGSMGAPGIIAGMAGGAAAGAVNSALNGGNLGINIVAGAAFGGFAGGVGGPLAQSLGGGLQGAVGSGALLGAAFGGIGAAAAGKNIAAGMLGGAFSGALLAAAIYGGCKAFESIRSQALGNGGYETQDAAASLDFHGAPFG
jgi:RHS repeat-associated protein